MTRADLARLETVHQLLRELNDAFAGSRKVGDLVAKIPVLDARVRKAAGVNADTLERALNLIGNRGLETVMLTLLEDLTILKAELDDP